MSKLAATDPPVLKRVYPHVDAIGDWRAQQTIRLLWDRVFALEARLQGVEATTGDLVSATNRQEDAITLADRKADEALAIRQPTGDEPLRPGGGGTPGGGGGALVWAWRDLGGPPIDSPYDTGPQNSDEDPDDFFPLIDRVIGEPADDWVDVLTASGIPGGLPEGVPPDNTMPHWALTQQVGAGGVRGRLFLPTSTPDGLGFYSRPFDVLANA